MVLLVVSDLEAALRAWRSPRFCRLAELAACVPWKFLAGAGGDLRKVAWWIDEPSVGEAHPVNFYPGKKGL